MILIRGKNFSKEQRRLIENKILQEYKFVLTQTTHDKISINQLVQNTNIAKGTFYNLFKDKESLFLKVIDECLDEIEKFICNNYNSRIQKKEYFKSVLKDFAFFCSSNKWLVNASGAEYQQAISNLSNIGQAHILKKKEKLWAAFFSRINNKSDINERIVKDVVSILMISNKHKDDLPLFDVSYSFVIEAVANQLFGDDF